MSTRRDVLGVVAGVSILLIAACGSDSMPMKPAPVPPPPAVTANVYILAGASTRGPLAFGDPPLVVYKGERLRWVNLDSLTHALVADSPGVPDFPGTAELAPAGEQSFLMTATGTTKFHCTIHPEMVGTLVVQ